jgi:hypothetical protein
MVPEDIFNGTDDVIEIFSCQVSHNNYEIFSTLIKVISSISAFISIHF